MNTAITFSTFSGFVAILIVSGFLLGFLVRLFSGTGAFRISEPRFASHRRSESPIGRLVRSDNIPEQCDCLHCKKERTRLWAFDSLRSGSPQNLTIIAMFIRFSCFAKSGANPGTSDPGGPEFPRPPFGVIPPVPV